MTDERLEELKKLHEKGQLPWTGVPLAEWEEFTARGGLGVARSKWMAESGSAWAWLSNEALLTDWRD